MRKKQFLNPMNASATNPIQMAPKLNKFGKIMLNPLGNNNSNKLEISFKAPVEINNNRMPPIIGNKKIKLAHI